MAKGKRLAGKGGAAGTLILLCLLWALDGLGPDLLPQLRHSPMPALERQAITYALVAALAALYAGRHRARLPARRTVAAWAGIGLLLFAGPALMATFSLGWVSQLERVAIFSLVPVFAVVLEPHLGNSPERSNGALIASLAAVAGALCIFPLDLPGTPGAAVAVLALVSAAVSAAIGNCIAVHLATSNSDGAMAFCAACACGAAALVFAVASFCTEHPQRPLLPNGTQLAWLVIVDLPALMLLLWLLRRMSAVRITTRFILAPLLTILAGIALERPAITTRMILGIALMAAGAMWLIFTPDEVNDRGEIFVA